MSDALETHPSPDSEYTRLLAEYLKVPEMIGELKQRYGDEGWKIDDPRAVKLLADTDSEIRQRVENVKRRTIELLRGK